MEPEKRLSPAPWQQALLVTLRVGIGWHLLYEGYLKLTTPGGWSAVGYLQGLPPGPLYGLLHAIPDHPSALTAVNLLNAWGLAAAGLGLMVGFLTPLACLGGMLMLALYYLANPPWVGVMTAPGEGNYLYVDKNLVEFVALAVVLAFNTGKMAGLDALVSRWRELRRQRPAPRPRSARAADAPSKP